VKYEIEIDDALVPEGFVPIRLEAGRSSFIVQDYNANEKSGLKLICEEVHVPKIPDFVPAGNWITKDGYGEIEVFQQRPYFKDKCWEDSGREIDVTSLVFDRDALFGDLPPEQCCFQQKKHEIDPEIYRDAT